LRSREGSSAHTANTKKSQMNENKKRRKSSPAACSKQLLGAVPSYHHAFSAITSGKQRSSRATQRTHVSCSGTSFSHIMRANTASTYSNQMRMETCNEASLFCHLELEAE
jgi:hypothetical protein